MTERFVAGLIGAPFGLKGFVKVRPLSGENEHLLKLQSVTIRHNGTERLLKIAESTAAQSGVLLCFSGIDSPEAVKALNGAELLVDREQASPLQDGEFYIEDLKGLTVAAEPDEGGEMLGHITDIVEGGDGNLAEIRLLSGESKLVPFRQEFFTEINPEKGRLVLKNLWILE